MALMHKKNESRCPFLTRECTASFLANSIFINQFLLVVHKSCLIGIGSLNIETVNRSTILLETMNNARRYKLISSQSDIEFAILRIHLHHIYTVGGYLYGIAFKKRLIT